MVYVSCEGYVVCKVQKTASGGRMELRQPSRRPAVSANRFNGGECDAGVSESGMYAAIIQFPLLLRTLSGTLAAVFSPTITLYYSKGDKEGLVRYANQAVRINGILLALPAALLGGLAGPFLSLWLGPSFEHLKWLLLIHAGYLVVSLSPAPLFYIFTAYNKLRTPALTTVAFGVVNLLLAIVLSGPAGLGLYGIALAGAAALMLKNVVFTPIYASKITGERKRVFIKVYTGRLPVLHLPWLSVTLFNTYLQSTACCPCLSRRLLRRGHTACLPISSC